MAVAVLSLAANLVLQLGKSFHIFSKIFNGL